jgi:hypothetical protein
MAKVVEWCRSPQATIRVLPAVLRPLKLPITGSKELLISRLLVHLVPCHTQNPIPITSDWIAARCSFGALGTKRLRYSDGNGYDDDDDDDDDLSSTPPVIESNCSPDSATAASNNVPTTHVAKRRRRSSSSTSLRRSAQARVVGVTQVLAPATRYMLLAYQPDAAPTKSAACNVEPPQSHQDDVAFLERLPTFEQQQLVALLYATNAPGEERSDSVASNSSRAALLLLPFVDTVRRLMLLTPANRERLWRYGLGCDTDAP